MGWVNKRNRCTIDLLFEDLRCAARDAVAEVNELLSAERRRQFPVELVEKGNTFTVCGQPANRPSDGERGRVVFELFQAQAEIHVRKAGPRTMVLGEDFTVQQRWDIETESCKLCTNGKQLTVDQIVQMALEPLFFA